MRRHAFRVRGGRARLARVAARGCQSDAHNILETGCAAFGWGCCERVVTERRRLYPHVSVCVYALASVRVCGVVAFVVGVWRRPARDAQPQPRGHRMHARDCARLAPCSVVSRTMCSLCVPTSAVRTEAQRLSSCE